MKAAVDYYTLHGIIVHPLVPPIYGNKSTGKAPISTGWQSRKTPYDAAYMVREISKGCNIGGNCGEVSDLTVIDIDYYIKGIWDEVFKNVDTSSIVTQHRTNRDGKRHLLFTYNPALKTNTFKELGFDIRNDGGNIVLAPSVHYEGETYELLSSIENRTRLSDRVCANIDTIISTYKALKLSVKKCRPCFYKLWKAVFLDDTSDIFHDTTIFRQQEGRLRHLALFSELKSSGATDAELDLACMIIFGDSYNQNETSKQIKAVDPEKTAKNDTLKQDEYYGKYFKNSTDNAQSEIEASKEKRKGRLNVAAKNVLNSLSSSDVINGLQDQVPIYFDSGRNFWMWNFELKLYERIDETEILCQVTEHLDLNIYTKEFKNTVIEGIKQTGRLRRVKPTKSSWIQFKNGVFDLETNNIFEATPEYFFVSQIPHELGVSEDTPTIDKLFTDWQEENPELLKEISAYCMYDGYPLQRIFAFIGPGGNGKGQYMTFLRRLLGVENVVGTDLDRLAESRFEASKLFKKKAAFVGETNYTLSKTGMLKSLCGGDTISGEFKGRDPFDFVNTAKIIVATNGLPVTTDRSEGFYRRWCLVEFKKKFGDGKDIIDSVPELEYQNFCRKSIRILKDMIDSGKIKHELGQDKRKEQYEKLSNPIQAFVNDECTLSEDACIPMWFLFEKYDRYRDSKGHRHIQQTDFAKIIVSMGFAKKQQWYNPSEVGTYKNSTESLDGKNWWSFEGITLNSSAVYDVNESSIAIDNTDISLNSSESSVKIQSGLYKGAEGDLALESLESGDNHIQKDENTDCVNRARKSIPLETKIWGKDEVDKFLDEEGL